MSYGPMIGLADLVRAFAKCDTEDEKEAIANAIGYERKTDTDTEDDINGDDQGQLEIKDEK